MVASPNRSTLGGRSGAMKPDGASGGWAFAGRARVIAAAKRRQAVARMDVTGRFMAYTSEFSWHQEERLSKSGDRSPPAVTILRVLMASASVPFVAVETAQFRSLPPVVRRSMLLVSPTAKGQAAPRRLALRDDARRPRIRSSAWSAGSVSKALIEEAEGLANVDAIAACSSRLDALILGFGDLSASMGMRFGHELDKDLRYPGDRGPPTASA